MAAAVDDIEANVTRGLAPRPLTQGHLRPERLLLRLGELAAYTPLYYQSDVLVAKNRLRGPVGPGAGSGMSQPGVTWNIFEWEVNEQAR